MSQQKQAMFDTNPAYLPVLPIGWQHDLPDTMNVISVRTGTDATMDFASPDAQRAHMVAEREANARARSAKLRFVERNAPEDE